MKILEALGFCFSTIAWARPHHLRLHSHSSQHKIILWTTAISVQNSVVRLTEQGKGGNLLALYYECVLNTIKLPILAHRIKSKWLEVVPRCRLAWNGSLVDNLILKLLSSTFRLDIPILLKAANFYRHIPVQVLVIPRVRAGASQVGPTLNFL